MALAHRELIGAGAPLTRIDVNTEFNRAVRRNDAPIARTWFDLNLVAPLLGVDTRTHVAQEQVGAPQLQSALLLIRRACVTAQTSTSCARSIDSMSIDRRGSNLRALPSA
jgi:hypothetical protein